MSNELVNKSSEDLIKEESNNIIDQAVNENDPEKLKDLVYLFNNNIAKKSMLRVDKLNTLLDDVTDQARARVLAGNMDDGDLIRLMNVAQKSLEQSAVSVNSINEQPIIQLNQYNINSAPQDDSIESLSKESRERVLQAIKQLMESDDSNIIDAEIIDAEEEDDIG